ncbi:hypothetical protein DPM19_15745 [Actinomadura craniellae]|uniref:DUF4282 domain-containing protein n=1 Tax=Actinomadura craniellae TaxID=2231787 RepID=A0A365H5T7_9ACTN|nr:DUF4282 domain-containing protein [Actinomadura craniellae]RAY14409.1 hypothetical protein DPM19_15745 [Actinomadura craniellae]
MTNPHDSGPQYRPPGPVGPYGQQPRQGGPVPGPRPGATGERGGAPLPAQKGVLGALLDVNFNHLVTAKLIKLWYVVALLLISLQCLAFLALGLWIATWDNGWAWGVMMAVSSPLVWLFEVLMVRILMEAVVVRFKGVEHLRVIKDKI